MMNQRSRDLTRTLCANLVLLLAIGCATPQQTGEVGPYAFDQAATAATDNLVAQTQKLPGFLAKVEAFAKAEAKLTKRTLVIDPMLDATSGQQTGGTRLLEQRVAERLRAQHPQLELLAFETANVEKAQLLLTGTLARAQDGKPGAAGTFRIKLALTDLKTKSVIAHASALSHEEGVDTSPTPYYRDSPIVVKDKVVDGYIRTSGTPAGGSADAAYIERVPGQPLINEATTAYNEDRPQDALNTYQKAIGTPAGEQLRTLNGVYLASWKLGKTEEAEQAFGKVVAFGMANNALGVKFLFNPGSTEFWSDTRVSGAYPLWLRQIARQAVQVKSCIQIVGHTSRTGSQQVNDRLSQQRAATIKQRLEAEAPELGSRTRASGVGFKENLVGTGTDDARDALDRRVEFKIVGC